MGGPELLLVAHHDNLLGIYRRQKCLILFNHRSLIHDYPLELSLSHRLGRRLSNCGYNDGPVLENLSLESLLVAHKCFKLRFGKHFDRLNIVAKKISILTLELLLLFAELVRNVGAVSPRIT